MPEVEVNRIKAHLWYWVNWIKGKSNEQMLEEITDEIAQTMHETRRLKLENEQLRERLRSE